MPVDERVHEEGSGLTVACVCVPGGEYHWGHVDRLHRMVEKNLSIPHELSCVAVSPRPGWWAKVDLFQPGRFEGRVLYLDLDVTVTGSLDDIVNFPHPFAIIDEWQKPGRMFNSSVMVWDAGYADRIYTEFDESVMRTYHGDQGWIHDRMKGAATFPKLWCRSYKKHIATRLDGSLPQDCRVVVYHGQPKSWALSKESWDKSA